MNNNITVVNPKKCYGCGACYSACRFNAIRFNDFSCSSNKPILDFNKCLNCGNCKSVCPVLNKSIESIETKHKAFVGYAVNKNLYRNSSSGGIFSALAHIFLKQKGIVYGAGILYENNKLLCKHLRVDKNEDLIKIQGSKYVQSDTKNIFEQVERDLKNGKKVLFSGTSCQIQALKCYLKKDYLNLLTIDLICHGVPTQKIFSDYVNYLEKKYLCKIINISFRRKDERSSPYVLTLNCFNNLNGYFEKLITLRESAYYRLFMNMGAYRESCYNCEYASINKPSDITLGDWYDDRNKLLYYSCIITNTTKGYHMIADYQNTDVMVKEIDIESAKMNHEQLQKPSRPTIEGIFMTRLYKKRGFKPLQKYINIKNVITYVPMIIKKLLHL